MAETDYSWNPAEGDLDDIAQSIGVGEAICTMREVVAVVDRPQDIEVGSGCQGLQSVIGRLGCAGEVCVYADLPLIQQPFWDVENVTVPFAPGAQLSRGGIGLGHQV